MRSGRILICLLALLSGFAGGWSLPAAAGDTPSVTTDLHEVAVCFKVKELPCGGGLALPPIPLIRTVWESELPHLGLERTVPRVFEVQPVLGELARQDGKISEIFGACGARKRSWRQCARDIDEPSDYEFETGTGIRQPLRLRWKYDSSTVSDSGQGQVARTIEGLPSFAGYRLGGWNGVRGYRRFVGQGSVSETLKESILRFLGYSFVSVDPACNARSGVLHNAQPQIDLMSPSIGDFDDRVLHRQLE